MALKIKKGDTVVVAVGKDRGKSGKVLRTYPRDNRAVVEGVNMRTRHVRARRQGQSGEAVRIPAPMHIAKLRIKCPSCEKLARVGHSVDEKGVKTRVCKKCNAPLRAE